MSAHDPMRTFRCQRCGYKGDHPRDFAWYPLSARPSLCPCAQVEYEMYLLRFYAGEEVTEKVRDFLARRGLEPHTLTTNISAFERKLPWAKG